MLSTALKEGHKITLEVKGESVEIFLLENRLSSKWVKMAIDCKDEIKIRKGEFDVSAYKIKKRKQKRAREEQG